MSIGVQRRLLAVTAMALAFLAAIMSLPSDARANGRVAEFVRQVAGPYEIALGTVPNQPVVGALHMTMTVTEVSSEKLVLDGEVVVTGVGPEPEPGVEAVDVGPIEAQVNDVNTSVDRAGAWTFEVDVTAGPGDASTEFAIEVKKASGAFRLLTWVTVLVFFALVGLGLLPMIRERGRRRSGRSNK